MNKNIIIFIFPNLIHLEVNKGYKEDQAFLFVTHTFALTGEEDYLMFKPSARVLSA